MDVISAITSRASVRAFLDKPVDKAVVQDILDAARWAPSGSNTQPWFTAVVTGQTIQKIGDAIVGSLKREQPDQADYQYYPLEWVEPYKSRRKRCGMQLYEAVGIHIRDTEKRRDAWIKNYYFFGAPVGLLFFIDKDMQKGSWVDMGMFIQNVMLAAQHFGLATCPQASLAESPNIIRHVLNIEETKQLICGISLGYPDSQQAINSYRTERESVDNFTTWYE